MATSGLEGGKTTTLNAHYYRDVCGKCGARRIDAQIGLEASPEAYLQTMVAVFREVRRVMRPDATCWVNLGDSYSDGGTGANGRQRNQPNENRDGTADTKAQRGCLPVVNAGLAAKQLLLMPARLALALQADGWWVRSDIIWHKPNPMPESVKGSTATRHMITLSEHERLSRVSSPGQRAGSVRASDMPSLSAREVPDGQAALSADGQGDSDGQGARGAAGRAGEAAPVLAVTAGQAEPSEIRGDGEGQGGPGHTGTAAPCDAKSQSYQCGAPSEDEGRSGQAGAAPSGQQPISSDGEGQGTQAAGTGQAYQRDASNGDVADSGRMASDSESGQGSLLLLPDEDEVDDGSCDTAIEGWAALEDECGSRVRAVQLEEEQPDSAASLVPCPGCDKCINGYIAHLYAGRPTSAHEHVFLLTRSARYFYDADAVREDMTGHRDYTTEMHRPGNLKLNEQLRSQADHDWRMSPSGRNLRNVWTLPTHPYIHAHFATYPPALAERCVRAGTSERGCCAQCGAPWVRVTERSVVWDRRTGTNANLDRNDGGMSCNAERTSTTTGWAPSCTHGGDPVPCVVLDPFFGAGTTGLVASRLQRDCIGIDLNPDYNVLARARIEADAPLFSAWPPAEDPADARLAADARQRDMFEAAD